jgi:hypothetical protein
MFLIINKLLMREICLSVASKRSSTHDIKRSPPAQPCFCHQLAVEPADHCCAQTTAPKVTRILYELIHTRVSAAATPALSEVESPWGIKLAPLGDTSAFCAHIADICTSLKTMICRAWLRDESRGTFSRQTV